MYAYQFEKPIPAPLLKPLRWLFGGAPEQNGSAFQSSSTIPSTQSLDVLLGRPRTTMDQTPRIKFCLHCGGPFPFKANKKFCCPNHRKEHWAAAHPKRKAS